MPCTTLIVGRRASYNGSTMIARNDDSPAGKFSACRFEVVKPEDQPRHYQSVISHVKVELPENPMRYTAMPDVSGHEGIWAAAGVNAANVGMTATETITSNVRVLSADPLVRLIPAQDGKEEVPGGIGEEDIVVLVLPYIHSAREGVLRLGSLLEQYGTYESNGIAFHDADEVWWLESVGGHHWIARKLPDDSYRIISALPISENSLQKIIWICPWTRRLMPGYPSAAIPIPIMSITRREPGSDRSTSTRMRTGLHTDRRVMICHGAEFPSIRSRRKM